jgi:biopolymer transport protein TolR
MPRKFPLTTVRPLGEINLTSFMDLTFLLLITFIITFPILEQGINVNLPRASSAQVEHKDNSHTITIKVKGELYLDNSPITPDQLARRMAEFGRDDPDVVVRVRADGGLQYEKVVQVLKILHDAKIAKMALVTQPEDDR